MNVESVKALPVARKHSAGQITVIDPCGVKRVAAVERDLWRAQLVARRVCLEHRVPFATIDERRDRVVCTIYCGPSPGDTIDTVDRALAIYDADPSMGPNAAWEQAGGRL